LVGPDFSVDLDTAFHADLHALLSGESVLQAITQYDTQRETLAKFMRAGGRAGCPNSLHLPEVPVFGGIEPLKVLLGTANHDC